MVVKHLPEDYREKIGKLKAEEAYFADVRDFDEWRKDTMEKFFFVLSDEAQRIRYRLASLRGEDSSKSTKKKIERVIRLMQQETVSIE